jgi:hypothetical protein
MIFMRVIFKCENRRIFKNGKFSCPRMGEDLRCNASANEGSVFHQFQPGGFAEHPMKITITRSLRHASKLALCIGTMAAFNGCVDDGPPPRGPLYPGRIFYGGPGYYDEGPRPYRRPLPDDRPYDRGGPGGPGGPVVVVHRGGPGGPGNPGGPGFRRGGPQRRGGQKPGPKPGQQNPPPPR